MNLHHKNKYSSPNYVLNMAKELDDNPINKLFNKWFIV
jgi:hypothetical protein